MQQNTRIAGYSRRYGTLSNWIHRPISGRLRITSIRLPTLIASMWVGNLMLVILNLPLIGLWIQLLKVPYRLLYPAILVFCCIGVYSINNTSFDVYVTVVFGALGYLFY